LKEPLQVFFHLLAYLNKLSELNWCIGGRRKFVSSTWSSTVKHREALKALT
jgi:hypothetical protein